MIPLAYYYVRWHYSMAIRDLVGIIGNFFWFFYEFFSIPLLLKTFFVPFHRLEEQRTKAFKPQAWAEALLVTSLMRMVGALLRSLLIVIGIFFLLLTGVLGGTMLIAWICAPLLLGILVMSSLTLIAVG